MVDDKIISFKCHENFIVLKTVFFLYIFSAKVSGMKELADLSEELFFIILTWKLSHLYKGSASTHPSDTQRVLLSEILNKCLCLGNLKTVFILHHCLSLFFPLIFVMTNLHFAELWQ